MNLKLILLVIGQCVGMMIGGNQKDFYGVNSAADAAYLFGIGIPYALIGLLLGWIISLCKSRKQGAREPTTGMTKNDPNVQSSVPDQRSHSIDTRPKQEFTASAVPPPAISTHDETHQTPAPQIEATNIKQPDHATWYKSAHGIGDKCSDLYLMHFEVHRSVAPVAGYKVLHTHPRKAGQVIPKFIEDSIIEPLTVAINTAQSSCPKCGGKSSSQYAVNMHFKCPTCKFTWWQKQ